MANDNPRLKLYNNLIASKKVTANDIGDYKTFDSLLNDNVNAGKLYNNLIKSKKFSTSDLGDEKTFLDLTRSTSGGESIKKFKSLLKQVFKRLKEFVKKLLFKSHSKLQSNNIKESQSKKGQLQKKK